MRLAMKASLESAALDEKAKQKVNHPVFILQSNIYGRIFALYPTLQTLVAGDSLRWTAFVDEQTSDDSKSDNHARGSLLPERHSFYRRFTVTVERLSLFWCCAAAVRARIF